MPTSEIGAVTGGAGQTARRLTLRRPDDWHVHFREGAMLASVVNYTARQFARAIVMPNLNPPVTTVAAAKGYRDRILAAVEPGLAFEPLMTCYLTDTINAGEVERGFADGVFTACKLYPAHATTNSDHGVTDIRKIHRVLEVMQRIGMPLLIHGEVTDRHVDIFDREAVFIDRILAKLIADFPALKVVFEHITTADAVTFVEACGPNLAATITPHHLRINRNAMLRAESAPITIASLWRSESRTVSRFGARRPQDRRSSSWAQTPRRIPSCRRNQHAVAPASSTPRSRSRVTP